MTITPVNETPEWQALQAHFERLRDVHLRDLFDQDADRGTTFTAEGAGLYLDYSKNRITEETLELLIALAQARGLEARRDAMFAGEHINVTEDRAVLHTALRLPRDAKLEVDGVDVVAEVHGVLDRMATFADAVRSGDVAGPHRQAHQARHQHRHRRLGPGPAHGLRRAALLQRPGDELRLRLQRRRDRLRRERARAATRPRRCSSSPPRPSRRWRR